MNTEKNISQEEIQNKTISEETINTNENENEIPNQELDLQTQLNEEKDKFLRLYAEFDNYKKRSHKEKIDLIKYGNKEVLSALLPVIDDFERAIKEIEKYDQIDIFSGVKLIQNKFLNVLKEVGLSRMEVEIGDDFNSDKHEAITQITAPSEDLKNKIIDVLEMGYVLHDKIIRFARVVVGS